MIVVGLDLSFKPGVAVLDKEKILLAKSLRFERPKDLLGQAQRVRDIADWIAVGVAPFAPTVFLIEEVNLGKDRLVQKHLAWVHLAVVDRLAKDFPDAEIRMVDTGAWRAKTGIKLTAEDRTKNKSLKKDRAAAKEAGVRGKRTLKHAAVDWANTKFGLSLKLVDNDVAEALAIAYSASL